MPSTPNAHSHTSVFDTYQLFPYLLSRSGSQSFSRRPCSQLEETAVFSPVRKDIDDLVKIRYEQRFQRNGAD